MNPDWLYFPLKYCKIIYFQNILLILRNFPCEQLHSKWKKFGPLPKNLSHCSCDTGVQICPDGELIPITKLS